MYLRVGEGQFFLFPFTVLDYLHLLLHVLVQTNFTFLLLQLGSLWYVSNVISALFFFSYIFAQLVFILPGNSSFLPLF